MITQLEVFTAGVAAPPIPIVDQAAWKDAIQIKKIDGLGPVSADINTSQYGSIDGSSLDGTYTPQRNIIITVRLNPDWATQTVESLRQILYSYFMPENTVRLRFTSTHITPVEITGLVESCEPNLFEQTPEYVISIICPQPYFIAVSPISVQGLTQAFATPTNVLVNYEGNADVGFVVDISLPSGGTAFNNGEARFINATPTTKLAVVSAISATTTTFFRYSSVQGSKFVRQYPLPSGVPTNSLGKLQTGSAWLTLRKGTNKLQILTATAGLNWTLTYFARYGGL